MNGLGASRVIDAHLHIWPEPRPVRPYPWTPDPHPVEALLPVLARLSHTITTATDPRPNSQRERAP